MKEQNLTTDFFLPKVEPYVFHKKHFFKLITFFALHIKVLPIINLFNVNTLNFLASLHVCKTIITLSIKLMMGSGVL